ncbi:hypothetical protein RRG08_045575 [Elysia crispata]|uniref:Uncharacterized protein n=1 Tax=Elysia crispata TaxID=231223 RepID=A0AAE1AES3_9GAST|nr:hypothetical protein RRG08_045575 [Elysia crispata]
MCAWNYILYDTWSKLRFVDTSLFVPRISTVLKHRSASVTLPLAANSEWVCGEASVERKVQETARRADPIFLRRQAHLLACMHEVNQLFKLADSACFLSVQRDGVCVMVSVTARRTLESGFVSYSLARRMDCRFSPQTPTWEAPHSDAS